MADLSGRCRAAARSRPPPGHRTALARRLHRDRGRERPCRNQSALHPSEPNVARNNVREQQARVLRQISGASDLCRNPGGAVRRAARPARERTARERSKRRSWPPRTPIRSARRATNSRHFHVHADLLKRAPNLLIVSSNGAGFDPVDVEACTAAGVLVVNQSGGNAHSVAEHALGMMLTLSKRIIEADRALRRDPNVNRNSLIGTEAQGKTIGIVGLGNVGRRIAELCKGLLGMKVLAYDPYLSADRDGRARRREGRTRRVLRAPTTSRSIARSPRRRAA